MKVLERLVRGKFDDDSRCEDVLVVARDHLVLADGATARTSQLYMGKTAGWIIAHGIASAVAAVKDPELSGPELVTYINRHLREVVIPTWELPTDGPSIGAASMAVYCKSKAELTVVSDIQCIIDGRPYDFSFRLDHLMHEMRRVAIEMELLRGTPPDEIAAKDLGWEAIMPLLLGQHLFRNKKDSPWGFGSITGSDDVLDFVTRIQCIRGDEVILATDGYPKPKGSLVESEAELARVLEEDPLMYRLYPSSKGLRPGTISFDDRAYVRFVA